MRINTGKMYLIYLDATGGTHAQPWAELTESGTLIDPDTGDDMEIVGWTADDETLDT